ncbi:MAG TPA: DEAD/DEAH box helicase [bacterium]|nr:DEAD/DEAH box helicase [bacterium]
MSYEMSEMDSFENMGLIEPVLSVLDEIGFEAPTTIQSATIPVMLAGRDVLGQAQTGTGKTAAFAMPILSMIDPGITKTQALVLVPTRELAIQLSAAFNQYAAKMGGVSVLAVYGGQDYSVQLKRLKKGAHIVVGTPGRVMDHMRRGTLRLENISFLVLDEADEMLQMGFIDDITWILEQTPRERQTALFSATLPLSIRKIAKQHMRNPEEIIVKLKTAAPLTINQRYIPVNNSEKTEVLAGVIESEEFDGMLVFVRTKVATLELVEALKERGYAAEALNGDIKQSQRERTVDQFKRGRIDILVATDVAARGLDVDRISHVINYDIPQGPEDYIHRVGRTGRAGRNGETILFATQREQRLLGIIERATKQKIRQMDRPSAGDINSRRIARFKEELTSIIQNRDLSFFEGLLSEYQAENDVSALRVAAALAQKIQGDTPFLMKDTKERGSRSGQGGAKEAEKRNKSGGSTMEDIVGMERYRIEGGYTHGAKPGNIIGAIANESGIDGSYIRKLKMYDDYTTVELPVGMPKQTLQILKKAWIGKRQMNISKISDSKKAPAKKRGAKTAKKKTVKRKSKSKI